MKRWMLGAIVAVLAISAALLLAVDLRGDGWEVLGPGGSVVGADGVTLSAGTATIMQTVEVRVERAGAPEAPLPEGATALTDVYSISADAYVDSAEDEAFTLAIPVPDDVPTDSLAIAFYVEGGALGHMGAEDLGWTMLDASFLPGSSALMIEMYSLAPEGILIQLVSGVDFVESEIDPDEVYTNRFRVVCKHPSGLYVDFCTDELLSAYQHAFNLTYIHFRELGFSEPRIRREANRRSQRYTVYLKAEGATWCDNRSGQYLSPTASVIICIDRNNPSKHLDADGFVTDRSLETVVHEYFHATQYGYDAIGKAGAAKKSRCWMWFIEGTAGIVGSNHLSGSNLAPGSRTPFPVDVPLTTQQTGWENVDGCDNGDDRYPSIQYQTEDFFHHLAVRLAPGQGVEFFEPFLRHGAGTTEVSRAIAGYRHPELRDLKHAYWSWAKNQAIERAIPISSIAERNKAPCDAHDEVATPAERTLGGLTPDRHESVSRNPVTGASHSTSLSGRLPPLTSRVIVVTLGAMDAETEVSIDLQVDGPNAWIKAYRRSDCRPLVQNDATTVTVPAGTEDQILILASNGEFGSDHSRGFTAKLSRSAGADRNLYIVAPDTREFLEGEEVSFRAIAPALTHSPEAGIQWSHEGPTGPTFYFGRTRSEEAITRSFCAGDHVVHASMSRAEYTAEDRIEFTVRHDPQQEAPECLPTMPDINIIEPADGATYLRGQQIDLRAELSHNELGLTGDDMVWEAAESATLHFGLIPTTGFDDLPVGEHVISVASPWGFASVTIRVADSDRPPSASILSPLPSDDGTVFSWFDPGAYNGGNIVDFDGVGSTRFSDVVRDGSLTWASRRHGTSVWREQGTGGSISIDFPWSGCHVQWYDIRLEVRDAGGMSAFAFVEIGVEPPPC